MTKYNEKGFITEFKSFYEDELLEGKTYEYDKNFKLSVIKYYQANNKLVSEETFKYNSSGKLEEMNKCYIDGSSSGAKEVYQYDKQGNLISKIYYDQNNKVSSKITNQYDEKGKLTTKTYYGPNDNEIWSKTINQYDEKGNLIGHEKYGMGELLEEVVKFNKQGKMVYKKEISNREDPPYIVISTYDYNGKGFLITQLTQEADVENDYLVKEMYQYDDKGNLIEKTLDYGNGSLYKVSYTYDSKGNCIEEIQRNPTSEEVIVIKRTIEYY